MQPSRVAIYARVSDPNAPEGTIASQIAALEARLAQDGTRLEPDHRFIDDGYTGATLIRPALERLRDAIAAGMVDRLYVHCPDRLARHYAYQVLLIEEFRRAGVEVVFLNRAIGTSPEDDLLLQVQGMVAEYERAKILERSRRGKRHAARQGVVSVLSGAPYGYRYVDRHAGGGVARYEILDAEAAVIRQIFGWIGRDRFSIAEVCRRLRQAGQRTRSGKATWDRTTVWGILRNPAYIGTAAFGKTRSGPAPARLRPVRGGAEQPRRAYAVQDMPAEEWIHVPVPALIEADLFEAVQEQLAENRARSRQGARGERYLLQGLLVCRQCGYAYYGKAISLRAAKGRPRDYAYYRCCGSDAYRFGGQRICSNSQVRTDRLDAAVWQRVEDLLQDPGRLAAEYQRRLDQAQSGDGGRADIAVLEAQMAKLRRGIGRLIDSYAEGVIDKIDFEPRITGFRQRLAELELRRKALLDEAALQTTLSLIIGRLEDFAGRVRDTLSTIDWHQRRELIRLLVKRVEVDPDAINIVFRVAPVPSGPASTDPGGPSLQNCRRRGCSPLRPLGSVRSRGRLPDRLWADRFPDPFRRRPACHELPALSLHVNN
jgi:site-specific DNA recombinase